MLTSHPLFRRFKDELNIGRHHLEWTTHGNNFAFRPYGADIEVIWTDKLYFHVSYLYPTLYNSKTKAQIKGEFEHRIAYIIETSRACRFWSFQNRELYFRSRFCETAMLGNGWNLIFKIEEEFAGCNHLWCSTDKLQAIAESLKDKFDKAELATQNAYEARQWMNVCWQWGTNDQLVKLLKAMGHLARQPSDQTCAWRFTIQPKFSAKGPYFWQNGTPKPGTYESFLHCLRTHFPLVSDVSFLYPHQAGDLWPFVDMPATMPSQHEKLEALLLWHDFLKGKIPAAQIDELLRPFQ